MIILALLCIPLFIFSLLLIAGACGGESGLTVFAYIGCFITLIAMCWVSYSIGAQHVRKEAVRAGCADWGHYNDSSGNSVQSFQWKNTTDEN